MRIANSIENHQNNASWIRAMFEKGRELKTSLGALNVADLSLGNPLHEPNPELLEVLAMVSKNPKFHRYTPNLGIDEAREKIAMFLEGKYGIDFKREHIAITAGAAGGIAIILRSFLDIGDTLAVFAPYFTEYPFYASNFAARFNSIGTTYPFVPTQDDIKALLKLKPKVVILNTPNNPTGQIYNLGVYEVLKKAIDCLHHEERPLMVFDDPYFDFIYDDVPTIFPLSHFKNAIYVSSFSKVWAVPGDRIGFLAIHPENANAGKIMDALSFASRAMGFVHANASMQWVLAQIDFDKIEPDVKRYTAHRDALIDGLSKLGLKILKPKGAFYAFSRVPVLFRDDLEFVDRALDFGVIMVPGRGFGNKNFVRMVFSVSMETIELALNKFKVMLQ